MLKGQVTKHWGEVQRLQTEREELERKQNHLSASASQKIKPGSKMATLQGEEDRLNNEIQKLDSQIG